MSVKNVPSLGAVAFLVAWSFDQLFWQKPLGISFMLFALILLLGWFYLSRLEKIQLAGRSLVLLIPVLVFSILVFLRQEPMTQFVNILLVLTCLGLLAVSWSGGRWQSYNLRDYFFQAMKLGLSLFEKPFQAWIISRTKIFAESNGLDERKRPLGSAATLAYKDRARLLGSFAIGLLLAFPIVIVLAGLLASADLIFAEKLGVLLDLLRFEKILEYALRLFLIFLGTYLLSGAYLHSFTASKDENIYAEQQPWPKPFLGWVQATTILSCVIILFAFFVAVQLRYFFGGQANVQIDGFTYAEYARRGFGELLLVACFSLLIVLVLSTISRRGNKHTRAIFSGLVSAVVILVGVILVSALQRMLLYEAAYGFTRLRTYTHVFMLWLGVILLATALLELTGRLRYFALAVLFANLGFGFTLNVLNVDGFIVRRNVARALAGREFDFAYLASLSDDAVIAMFDQYQEPELPQNIREQIGAALACHHSRAEQKGQLRQQPWMAFQWSRFLASKYYSQYSSQLERYPVKRTTSGLEVSLGEVMYPCETGR